MRWVNQAFGLASLPEYHTSQDHDRCTEHFTAAIARRGRHRSELQTLCTLVPTESNYLHSWSASFDGV